MQYCVNCAFFIPPEPIKFATVSLKMGMTDDRERICAKSIKETWDESQDVGDKKTVDDDLNNVRWKAAYRYDKDKNNG